MLDITNFKVDEVLNHISYHSFFRVGYGHQKYVMIGNIEYKVDDILCFFHSNGIL